MTHGDAPTAADFCAGCPEELDGGVIGRMCTTCQLRMGRLMDMADDEMTEADRAWLEKVEGAQ